MKSGFLALSVLLVSTALWAQGDGVGDCTSWTFYVDDQVCGSGCVTRYFYAPSSSSEFELRCAMTGCEGTPSNCHYTVELSPRAGGSMIAECDNAGQDACDVSTPPVENLTLQQGVEYQLKVCLDGCYTHPCTDCVGCVVRGVVCLP